MDNKGKKECCGCPDNAEICKGECICHHSAPSPSLQELIDKKRKEFEMGFVHNHMGTPSTVLVNIEATLDFLTTAITEAYTVGYNRRKDE